MTFQVPYAFGLILLILGVAFAATFFAYRKSGFDRPYSFILPMLRWLGLSILGLLLLKPVITYRTTEGERPVLVVLQDESESIISQSDSLELKSSYPSWLMENLESLREDYDVVSYGFDRDLHPLHGSFEGVSSAPGSVLMEALTRVEGRNVAGVVLATDGIATFGTPIQRVQGSQFPIHILALGDSSSHPDVRITKLITNKVVYLGNTTPIVVEVEETSLGLRSVPVELYQNGRLVKSSSVRLNNGIGQVRIEVKAEELGVQSFSAVVPVQTGENNTANNKMYSRIEVLENERNIQLVYAAPHPDISALRIPLLSDPSYKLDLIPFQEWTMDELNKADWVIFHRSVPTAEQWNALSAKKTAVTAVTDENAPYMDWRNVDEFYDQLPFVDRKGDMQLVRQQGFSGYSIPAEWTRNMTYFPPIAAEMYGEAGTGGWQTVFKGMLGRVQTETPLWSVADKAGQRLSWVNGEGWWRIRSYTQMEFQSTELYDEFVANWARWMLTKPGANRLEVNHPVRVNSGEVIRLSAFPKNAALEPAVEAGVKIAIQPSNGDLVENQMTANGLGAYVVDYTPLKEGVYSYEVTATLGNETLTQRGQFIVENVRLELIDTRARYNDLYALAEWSGGTFYTYDSRNDLMENLQSNTPPVVLHETIQSDSLLKQWWIYILILLLFTSEWVIRKREGRV